MCLLGRDMASIRYEATSADPNAGVKTAKPVPPELLAEYAAAAAAAAAPAPSSAAAAPAAAPVFPDIPPPATSTTDKSLIQMIGYQRNVYSLQRMTDSVRESIDELRGSTATSTTDSATKLTADYGTFLSNLMAYIAASSVSTTDSKGMNADMIEFRKRFKVMDDRKSSLLGSTNTFSTVSNAFRYYIDFIVFIGGPITAILLIMNMYATKSIAYKLLFSVFGGLWYPLTLLFSAIYPQPWNIVFDRSFIYGSSITSSSLSVESHEKSKLILRVLSGVMFVLWAIAAILLVA